MTRTALEKSAAFFVVSRRFTGGTNNPTELDNPVLGDKYVIGPQVSMSNIPLRQIGKSFEGLQWKVKKMPLRK